MLQAWPSAATLCHSNDSFVLHSQPPRAISEGRAQAEANDSLVDTASLPPRRRDHLRSRNATQTVLKGFKKGLDDRGLQLNPSKNECTPAKPLPFSVHSMQALCGERSVTTNASRCWEPPSALWTSASTNSGKAGPGGETHGQLVRLQLPSFFFDSALAGVRSVTMLAGCLPTACSSARKRCRQASTMRCLRGIIRVPISDETWRWAEVSSKQGKFGNRDPVHHSPASFLASSSSTEGPLQQPLGVPQHHTGPGRDDR